MDFEEFKDKYAHRLDIQQLSAVRHEGKALLLLAVPGSGKTTTLITKIGYMIHCLGVSPENILTVTYTKAAAADMKRRYISVFGDGTGERIEFRTINGLCALILLHYDRTVRKSPMSLISGANMTKQLITDIFRSKLGEHPTDSEIRELATMISYAKNMMLDKTERKALDKKNLPFSEMYEAYTSFMLENNYMDYDDQMVYARFILRKYPDILGYFRSRYRYICVDEAQDTSKIQHAIIALLAGNGERLFMVGDEDQSIYGFRAAYPKALTDFRRIYRDSDIMFIETNYRSDENIVKAADSFISGNVFRLEKSMKASRPPVNEIEEIVFDNERHCFEYLAEAAINAEAPTAVLYRENESALPLCDMFERRGTEYNIRANDITFFGGRLLRDITDIAGFARDPYNCELFLRIYYKLSLYITKTAAQKACAISRAEGTDIWTALLSLEGLYSSVRKRCEQAYGCFALLPGQRADAAVYTISSDLGYEEYLVNKDLSVSGLSVLSAIGKNEKDIYSLLDRMSELRQLIENRKNAPLCNFRLSTVHSAKGLEYDDVYLLDVYDGMFPKDPEGSLYKHDSREFEDYEEERRLFYVAATRAKNRLFILRDKYRSSAFADELLGRKNNPERTENKEKTFSREEYESFLSGLTEGAKIVHKVFGKGRIVSVQSEIVTVEFEGAGTKKLMARIPFTEKMTENKE